MREYETTVIVQPEISDEGVQSLYDRVDELLAKRKAIRLMYDDQGRRRMAYEIQNFQKGRYVMISFLNGGEVVPELERLLRLEDSVLRYLTVQVSDSVEDVEGRKAKAAEEVRIREQKAAERAAREAEERAAREAEEAARAAERESAEAAAAEAAAEAGEAAAEPGAEAAAEAPAEAGAEAAEAAGAAPEAEADAAEEPKKEG